MKTLWHFCKRSLIPVKDDRITPNRRIMIRNLSKYNHIYYVTDLSCRFGRQRTRNCHETQDHKIMKDINIDKQRLFTLCRVFSVAFYFLISQPTIQNSCFSIIICLILSFKLKYFIIAGVIGVRK